MQLTVAARRHLDSSDALRAALWAAAAGVAVVSIVVGYFDTFWWAPDEGAYVYVAQRILGGDVLNRDIQDIHAGYVNFANAAALWAFGEDLLSLRYPLAAMAMLQAALSFVLFRRHGPALACLAAVVLTALSTVQFLNPSAHWYALFLAVATIVVLAEAPRGGPLRLELVGFLLVTTFLFRQLSGVFLAMGTVAYLIHEDGRNSRGRGWSGRIVMAVVALGLIGYLVMTRQPTNFALFAAAPLVVLWGLSRSDGLGAGQVARIVGRLALGAAVAALPLAAYHVANGSVGGWYEDIVLSAVSQTDLDFIHRPVHLAMVSVALTEIVRPESMAAALNGVFWLALLLLPIANGMLLLRQVRQGESLHPLPLIAVFYALVSIHNQIPIYLWFSTGLSALAFLWLMAARHREVVGGAIVAVGAAIALYWHAGQPVERGFAGTLAGQRYEGPLAAAPEGATLRVTPEETRAYAALIDLIKHETSPGETILAIPNNPELYFLGGRRASVRFWNSAFGLRDDEHVAAAERMLATDPPRLVFHNPADKYNTPRSDRLMAAIKARYVYVGRVDDVDVYRRVNDVK